MKTLLVFKVSNVIDVITNSSSELFVFNNEKEEMVKEMLRDIYPNYLEEYEELKDLRDLSNNEIDSFLHWHLGRTSNFWSSDKVYNQEKEYMIIPGFKFEELYDVNVTLDRFNNEYEIKNNKTDPEDKWDHQFVTDENRERIIQGLENSVGRFFLYSIDENPNWDYQEKLMEVGHRYHLG